MARPENGGGQEEILEKKSSLTARIKKRCGLRWRDTVKVQVWEEFRHIEGEIVLDRKEDALKTATEWQDRHRTIWTNGSRLEDGSIGAAIALWCEKKKRWITKGVFLVTNKEVFDAEVFALL